MLRFDRKVLLLSYAVWVCFSRQDGSLIHRKTMLKAELKRYTEVTSKTEGKYANSSVNIT